MFSGRIGKTVGDRFIPFTGAMHADAMQNLLREMKLSWHVHGFRSSFRTWATKRLNLTFVEDRAVEACLDHVIKGEEVRLKYDRDGLLAERRMIAEKWATHLTSATVPSCVPLSPALSEDMRVI